MVFQADEKCNFIKEKSKFGGVPAVQNGNHRICEV